jgi:hypothetical protein
MVFGLSPHETRFNGLIKIAAVTSFNPNIAWFRLWKKSRLGV